MGLDAWQTILLGAGVTMLYSVAGGLRSVFAGRLFPVRPGDGGVSSCDDLHFKHGFEVG